MKGYSPFGVPQAKFHYGEVVKFPLDWEFGGVSESGTVDISVVRTAYDYLWRSAAAPEAAHFLVTCIAVRY